MDTNVWRRKCIIVMSRVVNNYISLYITDQSPSSWYVRNSNRPTERAKSQALLMYNLCILAETCFSFQNSGSNRELPRDQEIDDRSEAKRSYQYRLWASRGQGIFYYELHLYYQSSINNYVSTIENNISLLCCNNSVVQFERTFWTLWCLLCWHFHPMSLILRILLQPSFPP